MQLNVFLCPKLCRNIEITLYLILIVQIYCGRSKLCGVSLTRLSFRQFPQRQLIVAMRCCFEAFFKKKSRKEINSQYKVVPALTLAANFISTMKTHTHVHIEEFQNYSQKFPHLCLNY
jgi:hypothetical protein